jgi:hypothetical protein
MATTPEEVAFPRGGKQALSALERKRLREEGKADAEKDFLAGGFGNKKQKVQEDEVKYRLLVNTPDTEKDREASL